MKTLTELARGNFQRAYARSLENGKVCWADASRNLRGRAKDYGNKYQRSLDAFIARAEAEGYAFERQLDPKGGRYGSTIKLVTKEQ